MINSMDIHVCGKEFLQPILITEISRLNMRSLSVSRAIRSANMLSKHTYLDDVILSPLSVDPPFGSRLCKSTGNV